MTDNAQEFTGIAIIGMACYFPGARDIQTFWQNLVEGKESITHFTDEELQAVGIDRTLLDSENYVKAASLLEDVEGFDANFFGYSAREAVMMDPQQRIFLETTWQAIEDGGYDPEQYEGTIGVFAGAAMNSYYAHNLASNPLLLTTPEGFQAHIGNDKDYLSTRVSYKLNLKGPSVTVQTACSTSLAAVHLACQSLMNGECDMALAGGVSVKVPQKMGYFHQDGMPFSADGHCRTFDAKASGTIFGSGAGAVLLKRLEDAIEDGDRIVAVVKGSAMNNDGSLKIGYTAPSIDGQSEVIAEAQAVAEVEPETVSYIEAHGTATSLGDPIEIDALTRVFRTKTDARSFCAIGAVKTNVGHLETAAGIAGLIKTALMLQHRRLVPSLNFEQPNPEIDFASSPFYVSTETTEWRAQGPRRAGVSSFGIGGTNVHAVLEEAPATLHRPEARRQHHLLTLSAKTANTLEDVTSRLARHLNENPDLDLAEVAYTTQVGRQALDFRRFAVCNDLADARQMLESLDPKRLFSFRAPRAQREVSFMFPGGGAQYVNMGRELYETEPIFRETLDHCAGILKPFMGLDPRTVLYPDAQGEEEAAAQLRKTSIALPTLFSAEYSLAQLLMSWGIRPHSMIGHSNGEYVAATLAGVLTLEDALQLVTRRAQLMRKLPKGSMLSVPLDVDQLQEMVGKEYSIAAINSPGSCVVSGTDGEIDELEAALAEHELDTRRLHIAVGAHSQMADEILPELISIVSEFDLKPPTIPFVSNVTGDWIKPEEATDPQYWGRHLRETVRFRAAVTVLLEDPKRILLEVGPGQALSSLARQNLSEGENRTILGTTRQRHDKDQSDTAVLLDALGKFWLVGGTVDWAAVHSDETLRRTPLPVYPFAHRRYWIESKSAAGGDLQSQMDAWMESEADNLAADDQQASGRGNLLVAYVAPRDELETKIAEIWQQFFGFDQVGVHDNFFELGGTSLLATQLVNTLQKTFAIELEVPQFMSAATVAELSKVIAQRKREKEESQATDVLSRLEQMSEEEIRALLEKTSLVEA